MRPGRGIGTYPPRVGEKIRPARRSRATMAGTCVTGTASASAIPSVVIQCLPCEIIQSARSRGTVDRFVLRFSTGPVMRS